MFDKEKNTKERMDFVELWAKFVRTHPDEEWAEQHNFLINALMENANQFPLSKEDYLKVIETKTRNP